MTKKVLKRVVITGFGSLTSVGQDSETTWRAVKDGMSGITPITQWDASEWVFPLAAEIKDYNPRQLLDDRKLLKLISRQDVIGLNAVKQAIAHSQLLPWRDALNNTALFNDRTGIYVGSAGNKFRQQYDFMPLLARSRGDMKKFAKALFETVHPMWLLQILPNNVLAYTGIQYGFKGANQNIVNHGVSGLQAISEACHAIQQNSIDRAVVVAYESAVEPQGQLYYGAMGLLSRSGLRSFSAQRDGTVLAEGAGALVVESLDSALQRGANVYGEILGSATTGEAHGVFPVRESGEGLQQAINNALLSAQLTPKAIGMITAHGNGTVNSDRVEAQIIPQIFGLREVPVTGFKWSLGHALSAAGPIESILTLLALGEGSVPGIASLDKVADECAGLRVSNKAQPVRSAIGLIINRAFSGVTSCLVLTSEVV